MMTGGKTVSGEAKILCDSLRVQVRGRGIRQEEHEEAAYGQAESSRGLQEPLRQESRFHA